MGKGGKPHAAAPRETADPDSVCVPWSAPFVARRGHGFDEFAATKRIKGRVANGALPPHGRRARLGRQDLLIDLLPDPCGEGRIAMLQIRLRDLQVQRWLMHRFIPGV